LKRSKSYGEKIPSMMRAFETRDILGRGKNNKISLVISPSAKEPIGSNGISFVYSRHIEKGHMNSSMDMFPHTSK